VLADANTISNQLVDYSGSVQCSDNLSEVCDKRVHQQCERRDSTDLTDHATRLVLADANTISNLLVDYSGSVQCSDNLSEVCDKRVHQQ
jgi:hypothetical protein